jgi:Skp family chaperone for outer membrane proteins
MMASGIGFGRKAVLGLGLAVFFVPGFVGAQVPPEIAEINACLCIQQAVGTLSADMNAKNQALQAVQRDLADLDSQLARERSAVNTSNPDSVARYKALLERRDAAYRQSIGPIHADATQATARYNARVNEYNARCANRPFNSALVAEVQARLMCAPLQ